MNREGERINKSRRLLNRNLWVSLFFFSVIFIMPYLINVENLGIYDSLYQSIQNNDQGLIIVTSFKLVLMNAIRILPLYISSYTLIMFLKEINGNSRYGLIMVIGLGLIPLSYFLIGRIIHIYYDFGVTSLVMMLTIYILARNDFAKIALHKKVLSVVFLLIGLQWVDIIPGLSPHGFGRGEVSYDIKLAIQFINAEEAVTLSAIIFVTVFITIALLILLLLRDENKVIEALEAKNQMEIELREAKIQSLRNRTLEEMQNLVHDLKSPLTSIQGLVSLSEMMVENDQVKGYMQRITGSVSQLNGMISEILHEEQRHVTGIDELLRAVLAHLSVELQEGTLVIDNRLGNNSICINKIRFARVLINLINNSIKAIKGAGNIQVIVESDDDCIYFKIIDDGIGIDKKVLERIKERGFSTKGSTGIGLKYVEEVVQQHQGTFRIESELDQGTHAVITLRKELVGYEEHFGNR